MTVIHDASGCNSTYTTHDEPRWYDKDSMMYISGFTEKDAIMGNDERFVHDLVLAAKELCPKFVAICASPLPAMTGVDLEAIAYEVESETGIPSFNVKTNGMQSYITGAGNAFVELAKHFTKPAEKAGVMTGDQLKSINNELDQIFGDEMLKNVIVGALPLYSAQLDKTPFAQHAHIADFYNQSAFRIVGGSDHIAHSLVANIGRMGGRVITRCKVHRIVCDEHQAVGVDTDKGFINADIVVSTIHPMRTLELLAGTNILRPAFCKRINSMPQTNGGFSVYLKFKKNTVPYMNSNFYAYRGNTPWNCEQYTDEQWPKGFLYMHMCHKENPVWAESGIIISYMNYDEVAKWHGTKIGRRGDDYERFKKERAERLINDIERHFPGFKDSIDSFYTSTPLTYVDYTGTEQGSMYGIAKDISLGVAGRVPYRTRIPNLLLAGQNVNSHGMLGVLVGTIIACSELIPAQTIYGQIQQSKCR